MKTTKLIGNIEVYVQMSLSQLYLCIQMLLSAKVRRVCNTEAVSSIFKHSHLYVHLYHFIFLDDRKKFLIFLPLSAKISIRLFKHLI
jgi:hypothetical protein